MAVERGAVVVVVASPDMPGLVGRRGVVAGRERGGRWPVEGLREPEVDHCIGFPMFTADQLRREAA